MTSAKPSTATVGITGAYGYVGSLLRAAFDDAGWRTVALVRTPRAGDPSARPFDLRDRSLPIDLAAGLDVVVHAAWDLSLTQRDAIWEVNVGGSRRLLDRVPVSGRVIFVSSMSAFAGTHQLYGQSKLAVEEDVTGRGQHVIRPGLVYGPDAGGMVAALTRLARLPIVPTVAGPTRQFPVHADDLAAVVVALAGGSAPASGPIGVAQPDPLSFSALVRALSPRPRPPRTVPLPWQLPYGLLRLAERAGVNPPFRSDSLLGLVHAASSVPNPGALAALGVALRVLDDPSSADRPGRR